MPILNDILSHEVLGPAILQGREEGLQEGRQQGELAVLRRQITERFGPLPDWAAEKLAGFSAAELEELSVRVLKAQSIEQLLS